MALFTFLHVSFYFDAQSQDLTVINKPQVHSKTIYTSKQKQLMRYVLSTANRHLTKFHRTPGVVSHHPETTGVSPGLHSPNSWPVSERPTSNKCRLSATMSGWETEQQKYTEPNGIRIKTESEQHIVILPKGNERRGETHERLCKIFLLLVGRQLVDSLMN